MSKNKIIGLLVSLLLTSFITPSALALPSALSVSLPYGTTYYRGDSLRVMYTSYAADTFVYIQIQKGSTVLWADQHPYIGANTCFDFKVPNTWYGGTYTVWIKGDISGSSSLTFILSAPQPPSGGGAPTGPLVPTASELEALSNTDAANAIINLSPVDAAGLLNQVDPSKAAGILGALNAQKAAAILSEMTSKKAAAIMNKATAKTAALVLAGTTKAIALGVIKEMQTSSIAAMLKEAVSEGKTEFFSEIMNELDEDQAADILLETDPAAGAKIVEEMANNNLNAAAKRVEAAVKKRLGESDPAKAQEMLDKIAATLENADTDALVDIFIEIANLPATPSTVATVLETISLTKTIDVVTAWIDTESLDELAEVYGYFTDDSLETIWMAMSSAQRNTVYPYLDAATKARLPQTGEFQVSELTVTPTTVQAGAVVTVSAKVANVGTDTSMYTAVLKVDGSTEATKTVTIEPGASTTVSWTVSKATAGTYSVAVGSLTGSFTVTAPPQPAAFAYSSFQVSPTSVQTGAPVTVSVVVTNTGGQSGTASVDLKVNGATAETKTATLNAGASSTVTFTVTKATAGTYSVAVGSLTGSFTVTAPPQPPTPSFPWEILIVGVVLVAAVAYYLYTRRK